MTEELWRLLSNQHGTLGKLDDRSRSVEEEVARMATEDARALKVIATAIENEAGNPADIVHVLRAIAERWEQFNHSPR